jgi:NodT family efflux transporter outer membrane factor (OMF) lipoprotein
MGHLSESAAAKSSTYPRLGTEYIDCVNYANSDKGIVHGGASRRFSLRFFVLAILLALSPGCTSWRDYVRNGFKVGPNYCRPAAPVAEQWIDVDDPNVSSDENDDAAWWTTFRDPTLDELIQAAHRQNLTLRIAGQRILETRAQRAIAAGNLFPQTQDAFGNYTRNNLSKNSINALPNLHFDDWQLGTSLAWELDFWGRFRRAVEAADANLDASVENYDSVLVLLLSEVAQRYVDLRTAEQRLLYARKNVAIQRGSLSLAEIKFRNGATTKLDVTQGELNVAQTEATIPPLESARRQAANDLCILLGMPPRDIDDFLGGKRDIPAAPSRVVLGVPADLLRRRPDVRRAERLIAAQSARIGVATSELYPHLSIAGTLYLDAARFHDLFDGNSMAGIVGPSVQWNVLNYGRLVSGIQVEDARFQQAVLEYQNLVLKANVEAENSLIAFLNAQRQVKFLVKSTSAAEQSVELVREQYNEGKTDFNRVLTIEQSLTQQQDQLAVARGSVANSLVALYKALGGGWQIRLHDAASPTSLPAEPSDEPADEVVAEPAAIKTTPPNPPMPK